MWRYNPLELMLQAGMSHNSGVNFENIETV